MTKRSTWVGLALLFALSPGRAGAQDVLVYDGGTNGYALDACMRLGLTCTTAAAASDLATQIESRPWDAVVVDLPSSEPLLGWQDSLVAYVASGGAVVFSHWNSGSLAGIPAALEVTIGAGHDAVPFYAWDPSPLFDSPELVPTSFTDIVDLWGTNGFYLTPAGTAYAVAGFTMGTTPGQGAIVIGNSDRTIFNGFLFDDYVGDVDSDMVPDMSELLMNEIAFVTGGGGSTGPCTGLMDGAACTTPRGTGTCHAARCCTGCWDGTSCRGGTSAASCGVSGGACASCVDGMTCTSDVCTAGACSHPPAPASTPCDDGMYCTATDRCAGTSATCVGTGTPCDDGESCTLDACDEASRACTHMMTSGCFIGGTCIGAGIGHVAYPCLVCDPDRNAMDWSPRMIGEDCGMASCAAGRVTGAGSCDAAGNCVRPAPVRCPTGACADGTMCAAPCDATSCPVGQYCAASGLCMALLPDGRPCTDAATCASGLCVDGVCCASACDGLCEACDGAVDGTCAPIASGSDPDNECPLACDGAGACAAPPDVPADTGPAELDAGRDAGAALDGGTRDAGVASGRGGCSCSAARARDGGAALVSSAIAFTLLVRSRRRRLHA
jgi:hypothetical protein